MAITIPRVCAGCGKEYVRRGRGQYCEECRPPGASRSPSKARPDGNSKSKDIAYTQEFFRDSLATIAVGLIPVSKHDAAVVFNSARVLPVHIGRVMEQNDTVSTKLAKVAQHGSLYMLGATLLATVVLPIMANHTPLVPDKMKMAEDAVDETITNMVSELAKMMAQPAPQSVTPEPADNAAPDLDLSFLESHGSEAA